jgi:hypothetical protein
LRLFAAILVRTKRRDFDEKGFSPGFDLKPIRQAVADVLDSVGRKTSGKA